jgi:hypothetical protein
VTRSGHFNPVFKEAPHASQSVLEGMASRQGGYRASHTMVRHRHVVSAGELGRVCASLWSVVIPPSMGRCGRRAGGGRTRGVAWATPCRTARCLSTSFLAACIDTSAVGGPQTHADAHGCTAGRTAGRERWRGGALWRLAIAGVGLHHHQAERGARDGTAGMEHADMPDCHTAIGQDMLEEPAETLSGVTVRGAEACTAHVPGGERDRAVLEADETLVGEGDVEDRGGEGGQGGVAVVIGLTVDVPGDGPDLGGEVLQQAGLPHLFVQESAGDG